MTRQEQIKKIIDYFKDNREKANLYIEELNYYTDFLGDDCYYYMEDLPEYFKNDVENLLNRIYFGYDEDNSTDDQEAPFNPMRDFFKYNAYGNLISSDYKDYSSYIDENLIQGLEKYRNIIYQLDNDPKLHELFNELEGMEG